MILLEILKLHRLDICLLKHEIAIITGYTTELLCGKQGMPCDPF